MRRYLRSGMGLCQGQTCGSMVKRGIKNVIVLEGSESIGHGGSSRNGGGVRQSGRDVREINPYLSEEIIGASWCPTDGHANPLTTTLGFYKRSLEMGVKYYTSVEVVELKKIKGKVRQVVTKDGDVFEAEDV